MYKDNDYNNRHFMQLLNVPISHGHF